MRGVNLRDTAIPGDSQSFDEFLDTKCWFLRHWIISKARIWSTDPGGSSANTVWIGAVISTRRPLRDSSSHPYTQSDLEARMHHLRSDRQ